MNIKDVVKVIQASECAQIATFGKDETEGFPEIRALLNLANPKKYPKLKGKAISVDGETVTILRQTLPREKSSKSAPTTRSAFILSFHKNSKASARSERWKKFWTWTSRKIFGIKLG